jgi:glutathione S-transferase
MIMLHHLNMSTSERIIWLCEELGLPYELVVHQRDSETGLAPQSLKAIHPAGRSPVIVDGDVVLAETSAIVEYILTKHGDNRLSITGERANFADYLFWFHFANASFMASLSLDFFATRIGQRGNDALTQALVSRASHAYELVEARLASVPYFAGSEFSAADVMMVFPLTTMRRGVPRDLGAFPHLRAYLTRIGSRPAYQRAMKLADPTLPPLLT